jgi:hypothetical protein
MTTSQVICECGALYERTEFHSAHDEHSPPMLSLVVRGASESV